MDQGNSDYFNNYTEDAIDWWSNRIAKFGVAGMYGRTDSGWPDAANRIIVMAEVIDSFERQI